MRRSENPHIHSKNLTSPEKGRINPGRKGIAPAHPWTPEQDAILARIYGTGSLNDRRKAYRELMPLLRPHSPRSAYARAVAKGLVRPIYTLRKRPWTPEEEAIIERHPHDLIATLVRRLAQAGYRRTPNAVATYAWRLRGKRSEARLGIGVYSTHDVGIVCGVSPQTAQRWISRGWLKAKAVAQQIGGRDFEYQVKAADLRAFIANYTAHIQFDKLDKFAFVDLLLPHHGSKDMAA